MSLQMFSTIHCVFDTWVETAWWLERWEDGWNHGTLIASSCHFGMYCLFLKFIAPFAQTCFMCIYFCFYASSGRPWGGSEGWGHPHQWWCCCWTVVDGYLDLKTGHISNVFHLKRVTCDLKKSRLDASCMSHAFETINKHDKLRKIDLDL